MSNNLLIVGEQVALLRPIFLRVLRATGTIREAAESVGLSTKMVQEAMKRDPSFATLVVEAMGEHTELLEKELIRRAMNGSDLLLMFLLKARKPDTYREKTTVNGGPTYNVKAYVGFTPDEWDKQGQIIDSTATQVDPNDCSSANAEADLGLQAPTLADTSAT